MEDKGKLENAEKKVASLETELENKKGKISGLEAELENKKKEMSGLEAELEKVKKEICPGKGIWNVPSNVIYIYQYNYLPGNGYNFSRILSFGPKAQLARSF
jgi:hypothetical protein